MTASMRTGKRKAEATGGPLDAVILAAPGDARATAAALAGRGVGTAVLVELTYQVHGPLLLTFYRHPGSGATETQAAGIRFDGDIMIQKDPQAGGETRLTRKRAGGPQDPPIVGVWSTPHETGQTAFLLYTSDGRVVFRLPIRADRGRWSALGDQLTLASGPSTSAIVRYAVQGDRLVLIDGAGKQIVYTRAELLEYQ